MATRDRTAPPAPPPFPGPLTESPSARLLMIRGPLACTAAVSRLAPVTLVSISNRGEA
jgi:hypothetical protein